MRLLPATLALVALLLLLSTPGWGQEEVRTQVLGTDGAISFPGAIDTFVEERGERPGDQRAAATSVHLAGEDTAPSLNEQGEAVQRAYLLSLSNSGGAGIEKAIRDRYQNGNLTDARLTLRYDGGCNSPNGLLTITAIEETAWDPLTIAWNQTDLANGTSAQLHQGTTLAEVPISFQAANQRPNIGCDRATIVLDPEQALPLFTGGYGGLMATWEGEQPLTLYTLNAGQLAPRARVTLTTGAPGIQGTDVTDRPVLLETQQTFAARVTASDDQPIPSDGVTLRITRTLTDGEQGNRTEVANVTAQPDQGQFLATHTFPEDGAGLYDVTVFVTDQDGWMTQHPLGNTTPHLVVDPDPPLLQNVTLADQPAGADLSLDQGLAQPLRLNASDLACQGGADPCGTWALTWNGLLLGNGTLSPNATGNATLDDVVLLPRPGSGPTTLTVSDPLGHANDTLTWNLTILDTHPAEPRPLAGTLVGPGLDSSLERGLPVPVALQVGDDLPVNASLSLTNGDGNTVHRALPPAEANGTIRTELVDLPVGDHTLTLHVDDGVHNVSLAWGGLTVVEEGPPTVQVPLPGSRIQPTDPITARIIDEALDLSSLRVAAKVNDLSVTPTAEAVATELGAEVTIMVPDLLHGDRVDLRVTAVDELGLEGTGGLTVLVDAEAPELTAPANGTWYAAADRVRFEAHDPGNGTTELVVRGPAGRSQGPALLTVAPRTLLGEATLSPVQLTLTDDLGNERAETLHLGIDAQPPALDTLVDDQGLWIIARDNASGLADLSLDLRIDGIIQEDVGLDEQSPGHFRVQTGPLKRGQVLSMIVRATDEVGNKARLGTDQDRHVLTVPDRVPTLEVERDGPVLGQRGTVTWNAQDPDRDPLNVTLTVTGPDGDRFLREAVNPLGSQTIDPREPGRYVATVQVEAHGRTVERATSFHVAPNGTLTTWSPVPARVDPGKALEVRLSFPGEPQSVHVVAVDEANVSTPARVTLSGDTATATLPPLEEGRYELRGTVVHEPGATERFHIASVDASPTLGDRLGELAVPLLVVAALAVLGTIVYLVVWKRDEDQD